MCDDDGGADDADDADDDDYYYDEYDDYDDLWVCEFVMMMVVVVIDDDDDEYDEYDNYDDYDDLWICDDDGGGDDDDDATWIAIIGNNWGKTEITTRNGDLTWYNHQNALNAWCTNWNMRLNPKKTWIFMTLFERWVPTTYALGDGCQRVRRPNPNRRSKAWRGKA